MLLLLFVVVCVAGFRLVFLAPLYDASLLPVFRFLVFLRTDKPTTFPVLHFVRRSAPEPVFSRAREAASSTVHFFTLASGA